MLATTCRITGIVGAKVVIGTVLDLAGLALAAAALVTIGANAAIGAGVRIANADAAFPAIAQVCGAGIAIVAGLGVAAAAGAILASLTFGARVIIVAWQCVGRRYAALLGVADVAGAGVGVVADLGEARLAGARLAQVSICADVIVVTDRGVGAGYAAGLGVAAIVSAGIAVIARDFDLSLANAAFASVVAGTGVAIVARHVIGRGLAAELGITTICCARILIIADTGHAGQAQTTLATVALGANAAIVTRTAIGGRANTPFARIATICSARVFIVTHYGSAHAFAVVAGIALGALAAIVTIPCGGRVLALAGQAIVVRARLAIIAHAGVAFVGLAVAVVIEQIALLYLGFWRIAGAQALSRTGPLAGATAGRGGRVAHSGKTKYF